MQIRAFSKRSYKTTETCFYLKFTGFVALFLKLLSAYMLSRSMLSFHSSTLEHKAMFRTLLTP